MPSVAKRVPHLVCKGGRFYFRMRVPLPLVPLLGTSEVWQSLGDLTKPQAEVRARELAAEHAARFLTEKHRHGLAASPPASPTRTPAVPRRAAVEGVAAIARSAAREVLRKDEDTRITGLGNEVGQWWRSGLQDLDQVVGVALSEGEMRGLWHGLSLPADSSDRRRLAHMWAMEHGKALHGIEQRDKGLPVETPAPATARARCGTPPHCADCDASRSRARSPRRRLGRRSRGAPAGAGLARLPPSGTGARTRRCRSRGSRRGCCAYRPGDSDRAAPCSAR